MARIRSAKPELLVDEKTGPLAHDTWRLFVSSWLLADDYGNFRASPLLIHGNVFWAHPGADVPRMLRELGNVGLLSFYSVNGQRYAHINGWPKHQKVDHPGAPLCPSPDQGQAEPGFEPPPLVDAHLQNARETLAKDSRLTGIRTKDQDQDQDPPIAPQGGRGVFEVAFWLPYPRKVGKAAAKRAWDRLKPKPDELALKSALAWQVESDQWRRGFIPNPATYLNQKRWEDEPPKGGKGPPKGGSAARDREERNHEAADRWLSRRGAGDAGG